MSRNSYGAGDGAKLAWTRFQRSLLLFWMRMGWLAHTRTDWLGRRVTKIEVLMALSFMPCSIPMGYVLAQLILTVNPRLVGHVSLNEIWVMFGLVCAPLCARAGLAIGRGLLGLWMVGGEGRRA